MDESKAVTITPEEREERIRRILEGLKELGCFPPGSEAKMSSIFCLALGLSDQKADEVVELDEV